MADACSMATAVRAMPLHGLAGGLYAFTLLGGGLLFSDDAGRREVHSTPGFRDDALFLNAFVETLQELLETFTFL